jgi:hypothetical protein
MPFAAASERIVSIEMPSQIVSNLDHFVTQWMSLVVVWRGSAMNSSQVQRALLPSAPRRVKSQALSGVRGVGPAERTGKSRVSYWPGGSRPAVSADCRLPRNPREINDIVVMGLNDCQSQSYDGLVDIANLIQIEVAENSSEGRIADDLLVAKTRQRVA